MEKEANTTATSRPTPKPMGTILQERGLVGPGHVRLVLQDQQVTKERMGEILMRLGLVSPYDIASIVSDQTGYPYLNVDDVTPEADALRLFNLNICKKNHFLPLKRKDREIIIVTASDDLAGLAALVSRTTGLQPVMKIGEKSKIDNVVQYYYYFLENPVEKQLEQQIRLLSSDQDGVRSMDPFINCLFQLAVKKRASDMHIRPMDRVISIAFRVDGVMQAQLAVPTFFKRLITILKMRADMDIAEQRLPQDGVFSETILNSRYDIRVSTTICPYGENVVMRILSTKGDFMGLAQLGIFPEDVEMIGQIFNAPHGIILLTGPTGSGKTTTLYAAVRTMNLIEKNVLTVENPIEYRVPLIRQTQINVKAGYTFANAIRTFLRHDPDVILVGEIRDHETAETAVSASETGHLVLSTLHSNTAIGAIPRLRSLGIASFMLADVMVGVMSQRLVRRICSECKESYRPSEDELRYLGDKTIKTLYRGRGCEACDGSGVHGRSLVYEILRGSRELSTQIGRDASVDVLLETAKKNGFRDITSNALSKVRRGDMSVNEMIRVLGH